MMTHINVDAQEIQKFSDLAENWWDPSSLSIFMRINPLRLKFIQTHVELKNKKLDVGCGGGILTESLASSWR